MYILALSISSLVKKELLGITSDIKADTIVIRGWWPSLKDGRSRNKPPSQPRMAPFCKEGSMEDVMLPWTGCQAKKYTWAVEKYFPFHPILVESIMILLLDMILVLWTPSELILTLLISGCFVGLMEAVLISPPWQ